MSWPTDDDKRKKEKDRDYVACTEKYEVDYVRRKVSAKCPRATNEQIKRAIDHCCKTVPAPHPEEKFMACVISYLSC